jgi:hypothetical protein
MTKIRSDASSLRLHLDMGMSENAQAPDTYWGIPYNIVDGAPATTQWLPVSFTPTSGNDMETGWPDESDCAVAAGAGYTIKTGCAGVAGARFPFPLDGAIRIEGGTCNMTVGACPYNDRHLLVWEKSGANCRLWEAYYTYKGTLGWHASGVAAWDLRSMAMRPDGWTSSDAAGLPILPLLLRADEADSGEIKHALRVTLRSSVMASSYVWPASHEASNGAGSNIPFGALLRLRADFVIPATWNTQAKAIARAMQVYGVYVADNGSDLYVQGEPSSRWQQATFDQLQGGITLERFEFVDTGSITRNANFSGRSYRAQW